MDITKLVTAALKPFVFKMLPKIFEDFDSAGCDFATVHLKTGKVDLGVMDPFELKHTEQWDLLEGIENEKAAGFTLSKELVYEILKGLKFERHPTETHVICQLRVEGFDDVIVKYPNIDVWKAMKSQQKL